MLEVPGWRGVGTGVGTGQGVGTGAWHRGISFALHIQFYSF